MPNDKIYYNDLIAKNNDDNLTSIATTTEATGYDIEYVQDYSPSTKYRSTGITSQSILVIFSTPQTIKAVAWAGANVENGDTTFKIEAGSNSATTDENLNLTKASKGVAELDGSTGWNYKFFKITVTKASSSYVEFGKISLLADFYEFSRCYNWNYSTGYFTEFSNNVGAYGQIFKKKKYSKKIFNFQFEWIEQSQAEKFDEDIRDYAYIWLYSEDYSEVFFGVADFGTLMAVRNGYYSITLDFQEAK